MVKPSQHWLSGPSLGLSLGLFFVFALVFMGYSAFFALAMGTIGGLCAAWSLAWWNNPDPEPPKFRLGRRRRLERSAAHSRIPGIEEAQRQRRIREQQSPKGRIANFWRRGKRR